MEIVDSQGYSNTYLTRYQVKPRQPIIGKFAILSATTIFVYDLITPYGIGSNVVSNPNIDSQVMPAWGMIGRLAILAPANATLTIQTDLGDGIFTEIDTSPVAIATNTKVQVITFPVLPCFFIRGRL